MTNDHTIVQSYILDPVVVVLLDNKTIQVYQHEQDQLKVVDVLQPDVSLWWVYFIVYKWWTKIILS